MGVAVGKRHDHMMALAAQNGFSNRELEFLQRVYRYAERKHQGQLRKSGDPFIIHPIETAINLLEWRMDLDTVSAGLLHDVVEDTGVPLPSLRVNFNDRIAKIVGFVTKISDYSQGVRRETIDEKRDDAYLRQIFMSLAEDNRAIVVKLADRLHNMQTLEHVRPDRALKIANETLNIYGELAGRLGMYEVKSQLQDIAFKHIDPSAYSEIAAAAEPIYARCTKLKRKIVSVVGNGLRAAGIAYAVKDRNKSIYSLYRKLQAGKKLEDVRDIVAVRFVVERDADCYAALGVVHSNLPVVPSSFKDYIANPKPNMYKSLHTTVADGNSFCEVQIRTKRMDELADYGLAAHWRYKDHDARYTDRLAGKIADLARKTGPGSLNKAQRQLSERDVAVFIRNHRTTYVLPSTATALDLAWHGNPKRFFFVRAAKADGFSVSLASRIRGGAEYEFQHAPGETYNDKWAGWATIEPVLEAIQQKKTALEKARASSAINKVSALAPGDHQRKLLNKRVELLGFRDVAEFDAFARDQRVNAQTIRSFYSVSDQEFARIVRSLSPKLRDWHRHRDYLRPSDDNVVYAGVEVATCCTMLPGDHVVGVLNEGRITAHNANCSRVASKTVEMVWNERLLAEKPRMFRSNLAVMARWAEGIINELTDIVMAVPANINTVTSVRDKKQQRVRVDFVFYIKNRFAFEQLVAKLTAIPQVLDVQPIN